MRETQGFMANNSFKGVFSVPQGMVGVYSNTPESTCCLSEDELEIVMQYEEEQSRLGNFERIFPLNNNAAYYAKFFEHIRPANELLVRYLRISNRVPLETTSSPGLKKISMR